MNRFTDTNKWQDSWFQELPVVYKAFFFYLCDNCDNSGVWKVSLKSARFFVDESISLDEALRVFGDRVEDIGNGKWWLRKFISFQQKKTLDDGIPAHRQILQLLASHGLSGRVGHPTSNPPQYHPHPTNIPQGTGRGQGKGNGSSKGSSSNTEV